MIKSFILPISALNELVTNIYKESTHASYCEVGFSEDLEMDVVEIYVEGSADLECVIPFDDAMMLIGEHYNVDIRFYDVDEVNDGNDVGFIFYH
ncbi:hypothetical protein ACFVS2_26820 [Brevibacillus sp. NPDC058079]|uniref:hypothetical protein n=1 Tax=Brevibacillus sp. NPDC058079 TaxID=3346330 RepID=UPI0036E4B54D